jgi:uncharacterized Zn finger protein
MERFPCPKCGRSLEASGLLTIDGVDHPVYQCDDCTETATVFGEEMELAVTFAVDQAGRVFKPDSLPNGPGPAE